MDLFSSSEWPNLPNSGPATITMDGSPIHDIITTFNKQMNLIKEMTTTHHETLTNIQQNYEKLNDKINKNEEKLLIFEGIDLMNKLNSHTTQIEDLTNRHMTSITDTNNKIDNIEKKLNILSNSDININERMNSIDNEKLSEQKVISQALTQIKVLNDQMNSLKSDIKDIKKNIINNNQHGNVSLTSTPSSSSPSASSFPTNLMNEMKNLQNELNQTLPNLINKEELSSIKDLINSVDNNYQRDLKNLQDLLTQQQHDMNQLLQQQQQQRQQQQQQSIPNTQPQVNSPQSFLKYNLDEFSQRILTLEIRMNHLTTTPPPSAIPQTHSPSLTMNSLPQFNDSIKQQIYENEKNINDILINLENINGKYEENRQHVDDLKEFHDSKIQQIVENLMKTQDNERKLLNNFDKLENKLYQLEKKLDDTTTSTSNPRVSLNLTPPATPLRGHDPLPVTTTTTILSGSGSQSYKIEQNLQNKFKIICEELQSSLQSIRYDMNRKYHDLELAIEKIVLLPCEGCGGTLSEVLKLSETIQSSNSPQEPEPVVGSQPLEERDGSKSDEKKITSNGYTPSPSLMNHRLCRRRCPACLDREGLTAYTSKDMMEKFQEFSENLQKIQKKIKNFNEKFQILNDKDDKIFLLLDDLKVRVHERIPLELDKLSTNKMNKEDSSVLFHDIIQQYNGATSTSTGNPIEELIQQVRLDMNLLHTTTATNMEEEMNKMRKNIKNHNNLLHNQEEEIQNLLKLYRNIQESLITYTTTSSATASTSGSRGGGPTHQPTSNLDPEIKFQIKDLKERFEGIIRKMNDLEGNHHHSEENLKKFRSLLDTTRDEQQINHQQTLQQLQLIKTTLISSKDIEKLIKQSIISYLNTEMITKDRLLEIQENVEKFKKYEKIIEKKINNEINNIKELINNQKRIFLENSKKYEIRVKSLLFELQNHVENTAIHGDSSGSSHGHGHGHGYIPSFPSSSSSPIYSSYHPTPLSTTTTTTPLLSSHPPSQLTEEAFGLTSSPSGNNSSPKLKTYPEILRNTISQSSQSPSPQESPSMNAIPENGDDHEMSMEKSLNDMNDQIDFEDYVRNTLNPITEKKKKTKGNGG